MALPDTMPDEGCNFYGMLRTTLTPEAIAQRFVAAGWSVTRKDGEYRLAVVWGKLTQSSGDPVVIHGWLDRPDDRVGELLGLLGGPEIDGEYQWINAQGDLWRELPFDESMLDPHDVRLPPDIKASMLASRSRKPWWRFW